MYQSAGHWYVYHHSRDVKSCLRGTGKKKILPPTLVIIRSSRNIYAIKCAVHGIDLSFQGKALQSAFSKESCCRKKEKVMCQGCPKTMPGIGDGLEVHVTTVTVQKAAMQKPSSCTRPHLLDGHFASWLWHGYVEVQHIMLLGMTGWHTFISQRASAHVTVDHRSH